MDTLHLIVVLVILMFAADWLVYLFGNPLSSDFDEGAILAFLPTWLAFRRLRRLGKLADERIALRQELNVLPKSEHAARRREFNRHIVDRGRWEFTWERVLFCRVCLHWWLSLAFAGILLLCGTQVDWLTALLTYLITHFIIKKF